MRHLSKSFSQGLVLSVFAALVSLTLGYSPISALGDECDTTPCRVLHNCEDPDDGCTWTGNWNDSCMGTTDGCAGATACFTGPCQAPE